MYCTHCGQTIDETRNCICTYCRSPLGEGQYSPPEGFAFDLKSGWYYKSTQEVDTTTGQRIIKVLWFNPSSGEYKPAIYPDPQINMDFTPQATDATISNRSAPPIPIASEKRKRKARIIVAVLLLLLLGGGGFSLWYFELYSFLPFFSTTQNSNPKTQQEEYRVGSVFGEVQYAEDPNASDKFTMLAQDTKLKDNALLTSTDNSFCTISLNSEDRLAIDQLSSVYIIKDKSDFTIHLIRGNVFMGEVPVQPTEAKIVTQIGGDVCLSADKGNYSVHAEDDGNFTVYAYDSIVQVLDGKRNPIGELMRGSYYTLDASGNLLEDRAAEIDYNNLPDAARLTFDTSFAENSTNGNSSSTVKPDSIPDNDETSDSSTATSNEDGIAGFTPTGMFHPERADSNVFNTGYDAVGVDDTNNIYVNFDLKIPSGKCMAFAVPEANEENALGFAQELTFVVNNSEDSVAVASYVQVAVATTDSPAFFKTHALGLAYLPFVFVVVDENGQLTDYDFFALEFVPVYE